MQAIVLQPVVSEQYATQIDSYYCALRKSFKTQLINQGPHVYGSHNSTFCHLYQRLDYVNLMNSVHLRAYTNKFGIISKLNDIFVKVPEIINVVNNDASRAHVQRSIKCFCAKDIEICVQKQILSRAFPFVIYSRWMFWTCTHKETPGAPVANRIWLRWKHGIIITRMVLCEV